MWLAPYAAPAPDWQDPCPIHGLPAMKNAIALALPRPRAATVSGWWFLGAEAVLTSLLLLSDSVPFVLVRGLQLFLRF
jgi:hypothetical protein